MAKLVKMGKSSSPQSCLLSGHLHARLALISSVNCYLFNSLMFNSLGCCHCETGIMASNVRLAAEKLKVDENRSIRLLVIISLSVEVSWLLLSGQVPCEPLLN